MDSPNQIPIKGEVMSHPYIFVTLEHFSQTEEYNGNGQLLLTVLEKIGEKKLRASNSQLKFYISDSKSSLDLCLL